MKVISGASNQPLAQSIAEQLKLPMASIELSTFANAEKRVHITEDLHGENVVLVQSFSHPTDEHIMEFLLMADALERKGVRHVSLVMPWMGYSLQDKVFRAGEPIAAKVVANLISQAYIKRVFLMDLHNTSTPGFFSIPSHHLSAQSLYEEYVKQNFELSNATVASPDFGGIKRARVFATALGLDLVNIDKHRDLRTGEVTIQELHGDVTGKNVILLDDVILSGNTATEAAEVIKDRGAKSVHFLSSHLITVPGNIEKLQNSALDSIVITNSINNKNLPNKFKIINCAPIFAEALRTWL